MILANLTIMVRPRTTKRCYLQVIIGKSHMHIEVTRKMFDRMIWKVSV